MKFLDALFYTTCAVGVIVFTVIGVMITVNLLKDYANESWFNPLTIGMFILGVVIMFIIIYKRL